MTTIINSQDDWISVYGLLPREGVVVETKIDDHNGLRSVAMLQLRGNVWLLPDGNYAFYTPTHWRKARAP